MKSFDIVCAPYLAEFTAAFQVNHLVTGIACIVLMVLLRVCLRGIIRQDYEGSFAAFLGCCGAHHLAHASSAPVLLQVMVDAATALVAFATASILLVDVIKDRRHRGKT